MERLLQGIGIVRVDALHDLDHPIEERLVAWFDVPWLANSPPTVNRELVPGEADEIGKQLAPPAREPSVARWEADGLRYSPSP